jgi:hypothetical protein
MEERRKNTCDQNPSCHRIEIVSKEAADRAVKRVFAILGVDVDKPSEVEDFREDLRFGRKMRKVADHGVFAFFALVAAAFAAAVWTGITTRLTGGGPP